MKKLNLVILSALAIAGGVVASNRSFVTPSSYAFDGGNVVDATVSSVSADGADSIAAAIVTRADVEVSFQNDETYPWTIEGEAVKNGNCGIRNSTSKLTMNYKSDRKTELSFDWRCYNYNYHFLAVIIDGVQKATTSNSSYSSCRFYIEPGQHTIVFKDSIGNSTSTNNYSNIKNVQIKEILPLETAVLTEKSKPLTFVNDGIWPWTIEDGYIRNSNYGVSNTTSEFYTEFTIDKPSKFSFEWYIHRYDNYNYSDERQYTGFLINDEYYLNYYWYWTDGWQQKSVLLEPGTYTLKWKNIINNTSTVYYSDIRNVELSDDWLEIDLSSAGTLGTEVLYLVDVLTDVELIKVKGTINAADWTTIKQMKNLLAIDLSEAKFNAVPNNAFDGLSRLSNVKLPEGMTSIGDYAFRGTQLWNIDIPNSVTSIGKYAFYETRVKTVNFGSASKLQSIGEQAFYNCTNLRKLHIPDAVTTMAENVCYNCSTLVDLKLPANLKKISNYAFYNTSKLKSIRFPETLDEIAYEAFYNSGLDSVCLPLKLSTLGDYAFYNCQNLKYIELPSHIERYYRNFQSCTSLETVVCRSATPPSVSNDPFYNATAKSEMTLIVPSFAIADYKLDTYWYQFGNIVESEEDADYWKITGSLSLTNNRRMNGKPDVDLYYGGKLTVSGDAPMEMGEFNIYMSEDSPGLLLNTCAAMTADNVTTHFFVDGYTWYFFTPLHDVDLTKVSVSNGASYVFRYYDGNNRAMNGTGNNWKDVDNGKLYAGQGYIFQCNANAVITMPAGTAGHAQVFNAGDAKKALAANVSISSANKGWNYVGNPYPTYYDIYYMDFTAPITVWTGSTYKAYSIADDDYVLRPMQAFFVQKPDGVDNIVFQKAGCQLSSSVDRAAYARPAQTPSHASNRQLFDVKIADDELADEMRVVVNESASLSYEIECDASKFMSFESSVPQIFTLDADGNGYAINERPFADGRIQVAYYAGKSGYLTISATRADGDIFLYDGILNKTVNLAEQDYTFYSDATAGVDNTRFVMFLSAENNGTTGIDAVGNESKMNDNDIYDLQGRKVEDTSIKGIYIQNGKKIVK